MEPLLQLGAKTIFGEVVAFGIRDGERFYMLIDRTGISLMPAIVIETPVCTNRKLLAKLKG